MAPPLQPKLLVRFGHMKWFREFGPPQGFFNFLSYLEIFTVEGLSIALLSKSQKSIFLPLRMGNSKISAVPQDNIQYD